MKPIKAMKMLPVNSTICVKICRQRRMFTGSLAVAWIDLVDGS
jgi:hypothetical protein